MKIEITETPRITYSKIIYVFKAKIEDIEYKISRSQDYNVDDPFNLIIDPLPEKDEVFDAIENLFHHKNFHHNTTQAGEILEVEPPITLIEHEKNN